MNGALVAPYRIARKFGWDLNLVVCLRTTELKSAKIPSSHVYIWRSCTKPQNLNPTSVLVWQYKAQPPN